MTKTKNRELKLDAMMILKGFKIKEVSKYIGLTDNAFYKKRCGEFDFTKTEIDKLMKLLNAKYEDIF